MESGKVKEIVEKRIKEHFGDDYEVSFLSPTLFNIFKKGEDTAYFYGIIDYKTGTVVVYQYHLGTTEMVFDLERAKKKLEEVK